jgi:nitrite reductase/ring-hydroxylating ferredoxin subunit
MATRHKIADVAEIAEDGERAFAEVEGVEIAVFRLDGEYYAMSNYCVHQGGPLCEGPVDGHYAMGEESWEWTYDPTEKYVLCPWHGWKFDVTTGRNIDDDRYVTPTYEVEVEDGEIFVLR